MLAHSLQLCVTRWQVFGKRKSTIGMPRPKKTKEEAVEHLGAGTTSTSTGLTEQEEASASNQIEEDGGTLEDCEEESDKEARQQTIKFVKNARREVHAAAVEHSWVAQEGVHVVRSK